MKLRRLALAYARPHWGAYVLGALALMGTNGAQILAVELKARALGAMDAFTRTGAQPFTQSIPLFLALVASAYLLTVVVQSLARYFWRHFFLKTSYRVARQLRQDLYRKLGTIPLGFFHRQPTGEIISRGTQDLEAVRMMYGHGVLILCDELFYFLVIPPILFWASPSLAMIAFLPVPLFLIAVQICQKLIQKRWLSVQEGIAGVSAKVQENASGMRVLKAYLQEKAENSAFGRLTGQLLRRQIGFTKVQAVFMAVPIVFAGVENALVLGVGGSWVIGGRLSFVDFLRFFFFMNKLIWPTMAIGHMVSVFQQGRVSLGRLRELLDEPPEAAEPAAAAGGPPRVTEGRIEIRDLTFAYPGSSQTALHGVSADLPPRALVALVGGVGSGKSTLVHLLSRLYEPPRGTILIDGADVRDYRLEELRRAIGFVPQDPFLFSDTVRQNVAFSDPAHISLDEVREACRTAHFDREVEALPLRYEQMLGERGVNLSGGQRQRATIARALLTRPKILVLDDCLASVDVDTEQRILRDLYPLLQKATCLWITHRVLSTRMADEILVLEGGRVVQRGTFQELERRPGPFGRMVERQKRMEEAAHSLEKKLEVER